jgi:hypothetical protein
MFLSFDGNSFVLFPSARLWFIARSMSDTPYPSRPPREVIAPRHESLKKQFDREAGPEPLGYGEVRLWLVARDSRSLFAYWEFRPEEHPEALTSDGSSHFFLRVTREDGHVENCVEIQPTAGDWTIAVTQPDTIYEAELGFYTPEKVWCFLARSGSTRTPPESGNLAPSVNTMRRLVGRKQHPEIHGDWTAEQEQQLADLLAKDIARMASAQKKRKPAKPKERSPRPRRRKK